MRVPFTKEHAEQMKTLRNWACTQGGTPALKLNPDQSAARSQSLAQAAETAPAHPTASDVKTDAEPAPDLSSQS